MKKCNVKTDILVKTIKSIISLTKKDDKIQICFDPGRVVIFNNAFVFNLHSDYADHPTTITVSVSEFSTLGKLVKKEQVDYVQLVLEDKTLTQVLPNGLQLKSFFEPTESPISPALCIDDVLYLEGSQISTLSKTIQKQTDLNYLSILDFGFLFVGDRQVSYLSFADSKSEGEYKEVTTSFTNTQLNNLVNITNEIGFSANNYLLWGSLVTDDQLNLLNDAPDIEYQIYWPSIQESLTQFKFTNWQILKERFERELTKVEIKLTDTKQLEKLIKSSKAGISDSYDVCVLETDIESAAINFYFYQDKELRNSFAFSKDDIIFPEFDIAINLQTKHLLSLLNFSNNTLTIQYLNENEPIYSVSDLGVETITMATLLV